MSVHPNGAGTGWDEASPDADQPHGLDYRSLQDIRKGVRIRMSKQHTDFTNGSTGGIHKPGKCSVLLVDTTANLDTYIADLSAAEWGMACATAVGKLFFCNNATTAWTEINLTPQSLCKGVDVTWTGIQQFDASVDFTVCKFTGDVTFTKGVEMDGSVDISGPFYVKGASEFTGTSLALDVSTTHTKDAEFTDVIIDGSVDISQSLYCYSNVGIAGDISKAGETMGFLPKAMVSFNGDTGTIYKSYNVAHADRSAAGTYCISFTTALADVNYVVLGVASICVATDLAGEDARTFSPIKDGDYAVTGFRCAVKNGGGGLEDVTRVYVMVYD